LIEYVAAAPWVKIMSERLYVFIKCPRSVLQDEFGAAEEEPLFSLIFWNAISLYHSSGAAGNSEVTRVPETARHSPPVCNPLGTEPPTMRTSENACVERALARFELQNHSPETLFWRIMSSASAVETTLSTFEPSERRPTSVR